MLNTSEGHGEFYFIPDDVATVLADGCQLINDPEQTGIHGVVPAWVVQTHLAASAVGAPAASDLRVSMVQNVKGQVIRNWEKSSKCYVCRSM